MKPLLALLLVSGALCFASGALAAQATVGDVAHRVNFEQHLNQGVSAQLHFRDDAGKPVLLGDYFAGRPLVMVFTYFGCSNLCPTIIGNLASRLAGAPLSSSLSPHVLVVSVDPFDTPSLAARKKIAYLEGRGASADQWHFLTGDESAIARLAEETGFQYAYDGATHQYAHPAGIVLLTPQGKIARYLFGFEFTSVQLADALNDAAARRIASPLERVLLICFHYNPLTGPYSATIVALLQGLSAVTLLSAVAFVLVRVARRRRADARTS